MNIRPSLRNPIEHMTGFLCTLAMIGGTYLASPVGYAYASVGVVILAVLISHLSARNAIPVATVPQGAPLTLTLFAEMFTTVLGHFHIPADTLWDVPLYLRVNGQFRPAGTVFAARYDGQRVVVIAEPEVISV